LIESFAQSFAVTPFYGVPLMLKAFRAFNLIPTDHTKALGTACPAGNPLGDDAIGLNLASRLIRK